MKLEINWKALGKAVWAAVKPILLAAIGGRVVTLAGGVAKGMLNHAPGEPGEYAAELSFSLTNIDPEVDSETLRVPFRLVIA